MLKNIIAFFNREFLMTGLYVLPTAVGILISYNDFRTTTGIILTSSSDSGSCIGSDTDSGSECSLPDLCG